MTRADVDDTDRADGGWLRVGETVRMLGRTERAVRRYVAAGTLKARRVGSQLQISAASVAALAGEIGIDLTADAQTAAPVPATPPPVPQRPERPGRATAGRDESRRGFADLGAWKELAPLVARADAALSGEGATGHRRGLADRALAHLWEAAEAVAAGFGGFPASAKAERYATARRLVLAAAADLALLAARRGPAAGELAALSGDLEQKAARALTGLVRSMERRAGRRPGAGEGGHGYEEPEARIGG